jgi:hypothetical protein
VCSTLALFVVNDLQTTSSKHLLPSFGEEDEQDNEERIAGTVQELSHLFSECQRKLKVVAAEDSQGTGDEVRPPHTRKENASTFDPRREKASAFYSPKERASTFYPRKERAPTFYLREETVSTFHLLPSHSPPAPLCNGARIFSAL